MYRKPTAPSAKLSQTRFVIRRRQRAGLGALLLTLAACTAPPPKVGEIGAVAGFLGGTVAGEPRAALVARDMLSAGGTAADAATAAFFTMTVTYPVAVGLGGGGICLYYDHRSNKAETLDFRARPPAAGGTVAVPGALRGMALLHSRYGRLPWGQLVAPSETLARFGHNISRALAKRLTPQAEKLRADVTAAKLFLRADGRPLAESENLVQVELASILTRIRTRGLSDLYGGVMGRQWLAAATSLGGKATIEDLRRYRADWRKTERREIGNAILHFPGLALGESPALKLSRLLNSASVGAAAAQVFGGADLARTEDRGEAGIVVGDSFGSAAACVFQMNGAFGNGVVAPNMGVFLSPNIAEAQGGGWSGYPLPLVAANEHVQEAVLATAGAGGPAGAAAAVAVTVAAMIDGKSLAQAMLVPGRKSAEAGSVQAFSCPKGIRTGAGSCKFAADPQAFGLAAFDKF
jgi:gamma-glutamyltranspeptidase/glutathione hydrolase